MEAEYDADGGEDVALEADAARGGVVAAHEVWLRPEDEDEDEGDVHDAEGEDPHEADVGRDGHLHVVEAVVDTHHPVEHVLHPAQRLGHALLLARQEARPLLAPPHARQGRVLLRPSPPAPVGLHVVARRRLVAVALQAAAGRGTRLDARRGLLVRRVLGERRLPAQRFLSPPPPPPPPPRSAAIIPAAERPLSEEAAVWASGDFKAVAINRACAYLFMASTAWVEQG